MASPVKSVAILSNVPRIFSCISKLHPSLQILEIKPGSPEVLQSLLKAEVIVADFDQIAEYIYHLRDTKWIQGTWAGVEPIISQYEKIKKLPPCPIARFSGTHFGSIMSEYVVAHVTSFERDFQRSWAAQKNKKWDLEGKVKDYKVIRDMEVGVLGGGKIGTHSIQWATTPRLGLLVAPGGSRMNSEGEILDLLAHTYFPGSEEIVAQIDEPTEVTTQSDVLMNEDTIGLELFSKETPCSIAGVLKTLGARTWCLVRTIPAVKSPYVDEYRVTNRLDELLEYCDLIVNVLPHSASTAGLLNSQNLKKCKGSLLVNVGRGSLIAECDLIDALEKKYLRGAILDVFPTEPLPPESKLWSMPEVLITPHVAGLTRAEDVATFFKQNMELWDTEGRLLNTINFEKGY